MRIINDVLENAGMLARRLGPELVLPTMNTMKRRMLTAMTIKRKRAKRHYYTGALTRGYAGPIEEFLSLLRAGQLTHVGKGPL
jgi:hypothetical protein